MALSTTVKYAYSVGHVFNDLCAAMWFTYLLVYLHYVLQLGRTLSGFLLMIGQLVDAVATPIIGLQSDRGTELCEYGRRKSWHAVGSVCVLITFPFIFITCDGCWEVLHAGYVLLLITAICVFQFGWGAVQVSHLALSLDLTDGESEREELNLMRYIFCISSEVTVSFLAFVTFSTTGGSFINPGDSYGFEIITFTIMGIGMIFSGVFHCLTPEPPSSPTPPLLNPATHSALHRGQYRRVARGPRQPTPSTSQSGAGMGEDEEAPPAPARPHRPQRTWQDWLADVRFYEMSLLYTASRLIGNLATIYTPIYVAETVRDRKMIALVPLIMALSGVGASFLHKGLKRHIGRKGSLAAGVVVGAGACAVAALPGLPTWVVLGLAMLWGVAGSLMVLVTLHMASNFIGHNTDTAAFVYCGMGFAEKITNGLAVLLIQGLTRVGCDFDDCSDYYRWVMSVGLLLPFLLAVVALALLSKDSLNRHLQHHRTPLLVRQRSQDDDVLLSSTSSCSSDSMMLSPGVSLGYGSITKV